MRAFLPGTDLLADQLSRDVQQSAKTLNKLAHEANQDLRSVICEAVRVARSSQRERGYEAALDEVLAVQSALVDWLRHTIAVYSPIAWMRLIRRSPSSPLKHPSRVITQGRLQTAECLTALSTQSDLFDTDASRQTSPNIHITKLFACCIHLQKMDSVRLRLAKGAEYDWSSSYPLTNTTRGQDYAMALEDIRGADEQNAFGGIGTFTPLRTINTKHPERTFFFCGAAPRPFELSVREFFGYDGRLCNTVLANWGLVPVDFTSIANLATTPGVGERSLWSPSLGPIAQLLVMLSMLCFVDGERQRQLSMFGYIEMPYEHFEVMVSTLLPRVSEWLAEAMPFVTPAGDLESLLDHVSRDRSIAGDYSIGPCVRRGSSSILIDVHQLSRHEGLLLKYPRSPRLADARARHFERAVQAMVDESPWMSKEFGHYREKKLRHKGVELCDIDAIGGRDNTLLAISCKSVLTQEEFYVGDARSTANIVSRVASAVLEWRKRIEYLRGNPRGDNYDFRGKLLAGIVCVTWCPYVEWGTGTSWALPGLRFVVSPEELRAWLSGNLPASGRFPGNELVESNDPIPHSVSEG